MGMIQHKSINATSCIDEALEKTKTWIKTLTTEEQSLFAFVKGSTNGYETIYLAPCGSKVGWEEDEKFYELRENFKYFLDSLDYEDGSNPFGWIEISYGECGQEIVDGNCINLYEE